MNEKKFYIPGIILPAAGILLNLLVGSIVIDLAVFVTSLVLNLKKRSTHRTAIGIALSCLLALGILGIIGIMIFDFSHNGTIYQQEGTFADQILQFLFW